MTKCRSIVAAAFIALAVNAPVSAGIAPPSSALPIADTWDFDWDGFCKFWRGQFGKTTGVVGATGCVVGIGVLIICSAKKKT